MKRFDRFTPSRRNSIGRAGHAFLFAAGLIFFNSLSIAAQTAWQKTAGPPGVDVTVIYKANNIVYAGTEKLGVYRSTDNGTSWSAANVGIERTHVYAMIAS